jgi:hypothetical protein
MKKIIITAVTIILFAIIFYYFVIIIKFMYVPKNLYDSIKQSSFSAVVIKISKDSWFVEVTIIDKGLKNNINLMKCDNNRIIESLEVGDSIIKTKGLMIITVKKKVGDVTESFKYPFCPK